MRALFHVASRLDSFPQKAAQLAKKSLVIGHKELVSSKDLSGFPDGLCSISPRPRLNGALSPLSVPLFA